MTNGILYADRIIDRRRGVKYPFHRTKLMRAVSCPINRIDLSQSLWNASIERYW